MLGVTLFKMSESIVFQTTMAGYLNAAETL